VPAPRALLSEIFRVLAADGILFVKVPNARYNLLKYRVLRNALRQDGFDIFDSREHVIHYTPETLSRLLRDAGFSRVRFYVPRPIQAGAWWKRAGRFGLYWAARAGAAVLHRPPFCATDLAVLAWKR
jgi:hypothetical protein